MPSSLFAAGELIFIPSQSKVLYSVFSIPKGINNCSLLKKIINRYPEYASIDPVTISKIANNTFFPMKISFSLKIK